MPHLLKKKFIPYGWKMSILAWVWGENVIIDLLKSVWFYTSTRWYNQNLGIQNVSHYKIQVHRKSLRSPPWQWNQRGLTGGVTAILYFPRPLKDLLRWGPSTVGLPQTAHPWRHGTVGKERLARPSGSYKALLAGDMPSRQTPTGPRRRMPQLWGRRASHLRWPTKNQMEFRILHAAPTTALWLGKRRRFSSRGCAKTKDRWQENLLPFGRSEHRASIKVQRGRAGQLH